MWSFEILNKFGRESDHNFVDMFLRLLQTILVIDSSYSLIEPTGEYNQYVEAFDLSF